MYLVGYNSGSWDDYHTQPLFVTDNLEFAENYIKKAMIMLENVKNFVKTIDERIDELEDVDNKDANKVKLISLWCKYHKISDINAFTYTEIEQR